MDAERRQLHKPVVIFENTAQDVIRQRRDVKIEGSKCCFMNEQWVNVT